MKNLELRKIKSIYTVVMLALFAGIIFLLCGSSFTVKKGVKVDGIDVGGLTYTEASSLIRESKTDALKKLVLTVSADRVYEFTYPEINFKDNVYTLLKNAKKNESLRSQTSYYLCGMNDVVSGIAESARVKPVEPYAEFKAAETPFEYYEGNDGKEVDIAKLKNDILQSLKGGFEPVTATYVGVYRKKTLESVKKERTLLSSFTTYFDGDNLARSSNIRLAAAKLNGAVVDSQKTLSFNGVVGERIKSRGFLPAKIISDGEFVTGVGGGVCQVSTTLYNAALLSGLTIKEYHPHSLSVSYVSPSRDAMVSGSYCDLKITNPLDCPVYIRTLTGKNYVKFDIYGKFSGKTYSILSEVTGSVPAPEEECDSEDGVRSGKDGIISQSYLVTETDGYKKTTLLRKDKYKPVKRVVYRREEEQTEKSDEENL